MRFELDDKKNEEGPNARWPMECAQGQQGALAVFLSLTVPLRAFLFNDKYQSKEIPYSLSFY